MKRLLLGGAMAALAFAPLGGQAPQQQPVFRSGTVFVNVDAYPRRDGRVVEGLTQDDFEVFEDGRRQTVEKFEFIRVAPFTPDADLRDPASIDESNRLAADPHNRVFVIFLDIFHTSFAGTHYSREAILSFLRRTLGPNDLFAVMTPEVPVTRLTFGRRTETLEKELERFWYFADGPDATEMPRNPVENRLMACGPGLLGLFREDLTASTLAAMVERLGILRDARKNILFISEGWVPRRGAPPAVPTTRRPSLPTIGVGPTGRLGMGTDNAGYPDRNWCDQQRERLLRIDYERRFKDLLIASQQANVAFHTVDVGGLRVTTPNTHAFAQASVDNLLTLAHETGGTPVFNTNDLVTGVRRIAEDLSAFYLLGYYSSNTVADGKFRRIQVKVKDPDLKVSARRGYLAPTADMLKAEAEAAARPTKARTPIDDALNRLGRIRTEARVYSMAAASATDVGVAVELASGEFVTGTWKTGARIRVTMVPKDGGAAEESADGRIEPGLRSTRVSIPLPDGAARAWRIRTHVAPLSGTADEVEDGIDFTPAGPGVLGDPLVFRAGASPRAPLHAAADPQFLRTERVHVELALAGATDARAARLLGRGNTPLAVPVTLTERQDGDGLVLSADLGLAPLAAGDYVIEITASRGGETSTRCVAFRLVR